MSGGKQILSAMSVIVICEHAVNTVPAEFGYMFRGNEDILRSHRGYDAGAAEAALLLGKLLGITPITGSITRLIIDLNRSPHNRAVFSEFSKNLSTTEKQRLFDEYHTPFRKKVLEAAEKAKRPVLHISVHSFTPVLNGDIRKADIGILYNPARESEKAAAAALARGLKTLPYKVMKNSPYQGKSDGTAAWLRKLIPDADYSGIELELNQKLLTDGRFPEEIIAKTAALLKD
ncbi:N-formylglutamate amidohydrolase [Geovibrio thiophilus]|uniref:N-formylglutamate amidohydrolase n=1 Tax=Geovibrio thiophilus TaxID=139438 RepID=A0A3R5Y606_9BACT|nr:N-formylglutamate amidohydrolase [Geovibrio thiophilus]QAR32506.1 N-formylglutamate amidohydrolase [Geovibrio thiophilus]